MGQKRRGRESRRLRRRCDDDRSDQGSGRSRGSGEWVVYLEAPDGDLLWAKNGHNWVMVEDEDRAVFVVAGTEQGAGNPAVFTNAPLALSFAKTLDLMGECSLYSGGLVFKPGFGDYQGHTLTILLWHSVWHETDSGDVAPGLSGFTVEESAKSEPELSS